MGSDGSQSVCDLVIYSALTVRTGCCGEMRMIPTKDVSQVKEIHGAFLWRFSLEARSLGPCIESLLEARQTHAHADTHIHTLTDTHTLELRETLEEMIRYMIFLVQLIVLYLSTSFEKVPGSSILNITALKCIISRMVPGKWWIGWKPRWP